MGAGGFLHELIITNGERPTLLLACFALMGVPLFLSRDEKKQASPPPDDDETPPEKEDKS